MIPVCGADTALIAMHNGLRHFLRVREAVDGETRTSLPSSKITMLNKCVNLYLDIRLLALDKGQNRSAGSGEIYCKYP